MVPSKCIYYKNIDSLKYSSDDVERVLKLTNVHKGSVRWVTFNK